MIFYLLFISPFAFAQMPPIKIGMSTALSGPSKALGQEMKRGIDIYFSKVNAQGGVDGRQLELIALDDQYEPALTAINMHTLVDNNDVLAIIGNVGTPTAIVSVPIVNEKHILLFGAFSGANVLRKTPPDRYVINFRASYENETAEMIKGLLSIGIKPQEIAFFVQNDGYGDAGYQGALKALKAAGFTNTDKLAVGRYTRNTLNVEEGLAKILDASVMPKAIIIVGAYAPVAKFIRLAKYEFPDSLFLNVSFVGSSALANELGVIGENVIITQVVPNIEADLPAVKDYRADMKKYDPGAPLSFGSLEGYLDAKLFVMSLTSAAQQHKLNREGIIDAFETMHDLDFGIEKKIDYAKDNHNGLTMVWPTILKNGKFVTLDWSELKHQK